MRPLRVRFLCLALWHICKQFNCQCLAKPRKLLAHNLSPRLARAAGNKAHFEFWDGIPAGFMVLYFDSKVADSTMCRILTAARNWTAVRTLPQVPEKYLKHIEGTEGIFEIRVNLGNNISRIFCCFDEGQLIILFNGFQKKTQKTPKNEIKKAKELKKQYYADKEAGNPD